MNRQDCATHTNESKSQLKNGGLKITSARIKLLDIFKHAKKPLAVKEIAKNLNGQDLVTLYRNIESLQKLGIIKQLNLNNRQAYYELASGEHHHHVICNSCGKISDVKIKEVALNKNFIHKIGFAKITDHSLEFFGLCKSCAK
jgi:Fur family ferric uptake transcriptional regulator